MNNRVIVFDVGNSATEVAVFENEKKFDFLGFFKLPEETKKLANCLLSYKRKNDLIEKGMIFSVMPKQNKLIYKLVKKVFKFNIPVFDWKSYELVNKEKKITEPIGADLLGDIRYAQKNIKGSSLIADCGTITKLLLLDKNSKFIGLSMMPGIEPLLKAFNVHTAFLPDANALKKPKRNIGLNTKDSMNHGVYWSTVSYIKEILEKSDDKKTKLVITGGNSRLIKDEFPKATIDPYFTLKGLYMIYKEVSK